jgi:hypothetical protein
MDKLFMVPLLLPVWAESAEDALKIVEQEVCIDCDAIEDFDLPKASAVHEEEE